MFPMLPPLAILMGIFIDKLWEDGIDAHGMVLLFGVPLFILVGKDLAATPKNFTDLFVYNYDRPYPAFLTETPVLGSNNIKQLMGMGMALAGVIIGLFAMLRSRSMMFTAGLASVMVFALWFNWSHWVAALAPLDAARSVLALLHAAPARRAHRGLPDELARRDLLFAEHGQADQRQPAGGHAAATPHQPGREWSLVEHARLGMLKSAVGDKNVTLIDKDLNNKFVLVTIE